MKLTLWISALALALGASASSARANGESLPTRDPGKRDCGPFGSVWDDACATLPTTGTSPAPAPPPTAGRSRGTSTFGRTGTTPPPPPPTTRSAPPPSECGEFTIPVTASQLFPETVAFIERAKRDEQQLRAQLAAIQRQHQAAADYVFRFADSANDPRYAAAYAEAVRGLDAIAAMEIGARRRISEVIAWRKQNEAFFARVGTRTVRMSGCMSERDAINYVRSQFGAPPL